MISGIANCATNVLWCTNDENEFIVEKADGSMEAVAFFKSSREGAVLFSEALTVANEIRLTPRQLLEQRNKLLRALKAFYDHYGHGVSTMLDDAWRDANDVIEEII